MTDDDLRDEGACAPSGTRKCYRCGEAVAEGLRYCESCGRFAPSARRHSWITTIATAGLWLAVGSLLLFGRLEFLPGRRERPIALALLVPAVYFAPWPLRAAPILIAAGLLLDLLPIPRRWPKPLGRTAVAGGLRGSVFPGVGGHAPAIRWSAWRSPQSDRYGGPVEPRKL